MSKKSFTDLNPAMQFISRTHAPSTHDTQEVQEVQRTQGKKGQKLPRINMAFQTSNLEYLQIISRIEGKSITEYVNNLVEQDRQKNSERMEAAKQILKG
ncbi:MAG: hypothetical protein WC961_07890 [Anaerovoracaceae bacterium]